MLFHITHTHTAESCPYHKPEIIAETFGKVLPGAADAGVTVVGASVDAPAHEVFFVVEADSTQQIERFLDPIFEMGVADTRPVVDTEALLRERLAQG